MNTPLYKSKTDRTITGVCGGIAEYFGFNSQTLRIIFILGIFFGLSIFFYLALAILMPEKTN
ncbi:MAG: PspC domain-containing protein [Culicoidibacterales bacterium]